MDRKAAANETLRIMKQGYYEQDGARIEISRDHERSVRESVLITPEQGAAILEGSIFQTRPNTWSGSVQNISTVDGVLDFASAGIEGIGVLNFASAKNPGGGFLNGAMAQEESIAASSGLYDTLIVHEEYYRTNRAFPSMMYTNYAIYSPDVVFFRDGNFRLLAKTVKASVLTLPAVNMGQVLLKGEDQEKAKEVMKRRMALALALFADRGNRNLILGAYGCGVFRNDPDEISLWWKELLDENFGDCFDRILFAVLDRSKKQECIRSFEKVFGTF